MKCDVEGSGHPMTLPPGSERENGRQDMTKFHIGKCEDQTITIMQEVG